MGFDRALQWVPEKRKSDFGVRMVRFRFWSFEFRNYRVQFDDRRGFVVIRVLILRFSLFHPGP